MPPETQISAIAHVIQLAIAPVFLISGVATLLSVLANRLGRIVDRARVLEAKLELPDEAKRAPMLEELSRLSRRARLVNLAITFCTICALLICVTIATLFTGTAMAATRCSRSLAEQQRRTNARPSQRSKARSAATGTGYETSEHAEKLNRFRISRGWMPGFREVVDRGSRPISVAYGVRAKASVRKKGGSRMGVR